MTADGEYLANASDMYWVHTAFRREFGAMAQLIRNVPDGNRPRAEVVAAHVSLVALALTVHHTGEDQVAWPLLRERGADDIAPLVDTMAAQHHAVHEALDRAEEARQAWLVSASASAREAFAQVIERAVPLLDEHLTLEEEQVVPLMEKHMSEAEYARLPREAGAAMPQELLPVLFGMVMYESPSYVTDLMVEAMPPLIGSVIREVASQAWAGYCERVYGTATPPRLRPAAPLA